MSVAVQIVRGPTGAALTARLLAEHRRAAGRGPGSALWLTPTCRAAEAVRAQFPGGLAPNLFDLGAFADELVRANDPAARPLAEVQKRLLLAEVLDDLRGRLPQFGRVADTRGFADAVLGTLAESGATDGETGVILDEYRRRLAGRRLYDAAGRLGRAADLIGDGRREPFAAVRAVFLDGFVGFGPAKWRLLDSLRGWVEEMWVSLPGEAGGEREELFAPAETTRERLEGWGAGAEMVEPRVPGFRKASTRGSTPTGIKPRVESAEPGDSALALHHLARHLFRPAPPRSADADGLERIEAPGPVGEARLVARAVHALLEQGVPPDVIAVTARHVEPEIDRWREVFAEYGIPADLEGAEPLARNPAVATLLRAARLPESDFPFPAVTALLRSNYFRPEWPEAAGEPTLPQQAEALLRLLGEPRGRDAYLRAVAQWADAPPDGLEDEQAEGPRRLRQHGLAVRCRAFLGRFFRCWDRMPGPAPLAEHAAWLRRFAADIGLSTAAEEPRDRDALDRLFRELGAWERTGRPRPLSRGDFARLLGTVAAGVGLARSPRGPGRVRVLSAELACHRPVDYLFVVGLGERSFPDLAGPATLLDAAPVDRRPDEMLLFFRLLTCARRKLVLSYAAVDEKGQDLLPSSFLRAVLDCFEPGAAPVQRQRMLTEGFDRRRPRSPAERRWRLAREIREGQRTEDRGQTEGVLSVLCPLSSVPLYSQDLADHLKAAAEISRRRFRTRDFSPFDGLLRHPAVLAELAERFGPERVFSPTALEHYVACPFRFFLEDVLRLEPLEEPAEAVESTRRGAAVHRALSRLHRRLAERPPAADGPVAADVTEQLLADLDAAVAEYVERAASPASRELWRLEGRRLRRSAVRYAEQWRKFVGPWRPAGATPQPAHFEADFGLPDAALGPLKLVGEGGEVRVGGRIDRVDLAELPGGAVGFWVIDYKTGRAANYSAADLSGLRRLQLTLYALAVERVFLAGRPARPLGLAYWLVTDTGPKPVLPAGRQPTAWLASADGWEAFRTRLERWVTELAGHIRSGDFPLAPRDEDCTDTCPYGQVCRISQSRRVGKTWALSPPSAGG